MILIALINIVMFNYTPVVQLFIGKDLSLFCCYEPAGSHSTSPVQSPILSGNEIYTRALVWLASPFARFWCLSSTKRCKIGL